MILKNEVFASISSGKRIFVIASANGDATRLRALHQKISSHFMVGDTVVYLGNIIGNLGNSARAVDEALLFRRALISIPGVNQDDVIYLRGSFEEMFHKLMQIQFSSNASQIYEWMIEQGLTSVLSSYDIDSNEGARMMKQGVIAIARWVSSVRKAQGLNDGHLAYMHELKHAAYTQNNSLLFVHRGIFHDLSLALQGDSFWWGGSLPFHRADGFENFNQVVRCIISDKSDHITADMHYMTIPSHSSLPLYAVLFDKEGQVDEVLSV